MTLPPGDARRSGLERVTDVLRWFLDGYIKGSYAMAGMFPSPPSDPVEDDAVRREAGAGVAAIEEFLRRLSA